MLVGVVRCTTSVSRLHWSRSRVADGGHSRVGGRGYDRVDAAAISKVKAVTTCKSRRNGIRDGVGKHAVGGCGALRNTDFTIALESQHVAHWTFANYERVFDVDSELFHTWWKREKEKEKKMKKKELKEGKILRLWSIFLSVCSPLEAWSLG
uniref:Uncharacterized protein n=1 Tax=Ananas comosus var. bracteatus TaxID=296719 RepID=A0A6V7NY50_ANACO|nr:unnamed protein product [Ananas comosus var. bracteatus]